MKREAWDKKMQEAVPAGGAQVCARGEELVAYLYGEASETAARNFEAHMQDCSACRTEFAAFGEVRSSINEWRQLSLGSPASAANAAHGSDAASVTQSRRRSALAALREFFALSPMWMRAATAVTSAAVCALIALAVAHAEVRWDAGGLSFRTGVSGERVVERTRTVEVEKPVKVGLSQEEVDQIVAQRIARERESWESQRTPPARIITTGVPARQTMARNSSQPSSGFTSRNLSRQAVAQRDRLDEEDLPRLYDLLGDSN
jgi:hypothetical protein